MFIKLWIIVIQNSEKSVDFKEVKLNMSELGTIFNQYLKTFDGFVFSQSQAINFVNYEQIKLTSRT